MIFGQPRIARILTNKNIRAIRVISSPDNKKQLTSVSCLKQKTGAVKPMIFSQPRMTQILTNKNIRTLRVISGLNNKKAAY